MVNIACVEQGTLDDRWREGQGESERGSREKTGTKKE